MSLMVVDMESLSMAGAFSHHPELLDAIPRVTIAAVGGMAPKYLPAGVSFRDLLLHRVGMGSILTYGNRNGKNCVEFGTKALETGEDWEAKVFLITFLITHISEGSRFAFAADGRFHLSWQEHQPVGVPRCILVTGSWKDWVKYARFADDKSFAQSHRDILCGVKVALQEFE